MNLIKFYIHLFKNDNFSVVMFDFLRKISILDNSAIVI